MDLLRTTIDLDAIARNVATFKNLAAPARLMCVVKADAYNHGATRAAAVMEAAGADAFGVATLEEAVALRRGGIGKPIAAWIWDAGADLSDAAAHNVELGVPSLRHAHAVVDSGIHFKVYVKVETGMHRSGVDEAQWKETFELLRDAENVEVLGLMSHFACADEPEHPHNDLQEEAFRRALRLAREMGLECPLNHLSNTPATLTRPSARFEMVRVGLGLYGHEPVEGLDHGLKPAMTWAATVINVKPIAAGEGTSYSQTWSAPADGYLATVACGYADGLPRMVQGALQVGIAGTLYPQVGRVCMDQIVVYLGANEAGVAKGDEAVLFGDGGMSATELAAAVGTINYEIICRPAGRTVRHYQQES